MLIFQPVWPLRARTHAQSVSQSSCKGSTGWFISSHWKQPLSSLHISVKVPAPETASTVENVTELPAGISQANSYSNICLFQNYNGTIPGLWVEPGFHTSLRCQVQQRWIQPSVFTFTACLVLLLKSKHNQRFCLSGILTLLFLFSVTSLLHWIVIMFIIIFHGPYFWLILQLLFLVCSKSVIIS